MKKIKQVLFFITLFVISIGSVNATVSSSFSARLTSTSTPNVGGTVIVSVSNSNAVGTYSASSSNSGVLSISGESEIFVDSPGVFYFKANSAGTAIITIRPISIYDNDANVVNVSSL